MKSETKIGYTVLRYVHDIATQEFVNIGVLAYAPEKRQLKLKCTEKLNRVHALFPQTDVKQLKALISQVQDAFHTYGIHLAETTSENDIPSKVMKAAAKIIPNDTSALQWSSPAGGYVESFTLGLEQAFQRHIERYNPLPRGQRLRGTGAILKSFRKILNNENVLSYLNPVRITGALGFYDFTLSWKNHQYHCYEAVNLNLKDAKKLKAEATEWVGRATALAKSSTEHQLYLLLAEPTTPLLKGDYHAVVKGMQDILPPQTQIIPQSNIMEFSQREALAIKHHFSETP